MSKRISIAIAALTLCAALTAAGAWWYLRPDEPEWTTPSAAAREELRAGLDNLQKIYLPDVRVHLARAVELDPDFLVAKMYLSRFVGGEQRRRLNEELRSADLTPLTPRERFLIEHHLAAVDDAAEKRREILRAYRAEHPSDPYGLEVECNGFWNRQQWDQAVLCYEGLLRQNPNWVEAQNRLGYIAMGEGRFSDAEEHFLTYRYIAPDQANPYHSLSELLLVLGRYDEAEAGLREVVRIKPDFCEAFTVWIELDTLRGEPEKGWERLRQLAAQPVCAIYTDNGYICSTEAWLRYLTGDPEGAWAGIVESGCLARSSFAKSLVTYRLALMTGHTAEATEIATSCQEGAVVGSFGDGHIVAGLEAFMTGLQQLAADDAAAAADSFATADQRLLYWEIGGKAINLKLFNRMHLMRALELAGRDAEALAVRRKIEAVNPRFLTDFRLPAGDILNR